MFKEITIRDKAYPCRVTMGSILRFKRETGKELSDAKSRSVEDSIVFIWCCVKSACNADKVEFALSLDDFADSLDPEDMEKFLSDIQNDAPTDSKKKGPKK